MKRKILTLSLGLIFIVSSIGGCGSNTVSETTTAKATAETTTEMNTEVGTETTAFTSTTGPDANVNGKNIKIGFSGDYLTDFVSYVVNGLNDYTKDNHTV